MTEIIDDRSLIVFDEAAYLNNYPDIRHLVESKVLASGYSHWIEHGFKEEEQGIRNASWRKFPPIKDIQKLLTFSPKELAFIFNDADSVELNEKRRLSLMVFNLMNKVNALKYKPLFSIIIPTYNVASEWLEYAILSCLNQIYDNIEICIVDDHSTNPDTVRTIERFANLDPRILYKLRVSNGHISAATNDALEMASGEFICLLDHDDELTIDAIAEVAILINSNPNVDYIYTDEDKIDTNGNTYGRFFKPAWSPELILACGYTTHLSVYRTKLIKKIGGFRSFFDGAQDYDLVLRVSEVTNNILHLPKNLYHWRTLETSTAACLDNKGYAFNKAKKALESHFKRLNIDASISDGFYKGHTKVQYSYPDRPLVSIVIPTAGKNVTIINKRINLVENCVSSIVNKSSYINYEVIISENGDLPLATKSSLVRMGAKLVPYRSSKFNLAEKINQTASYAKGDYLIILNDDIEVISENWIEEMLQYCRLEGVGCVGAKLLFPDDTIQHVGVSISNAMPGHPYYGCERNSVGHAGMLTMATNVSAVTGACMMTPKVVFDAHKGYSEDFPLNYNDVDYCLRLGMSGYRTIMNPFVELYHYESVSKEGAGSVSEVELDLFKTKWLAKCISEKYIFRA